MERNMDYVNTECKPTTCVIIFIVKTHELHSLDCPWEPQKILKIILKWKIKWQSDAPRASFRRPVLAGACVPHVRPTDVPPIRTPHQNGYKNILKVKVVKSYISNKTIKEQIKNLFKKIYKPNIF